MKVDTDYMVPQAMANRDFGRVCRIANRNAYAMILCHSRPRYLLINIDELREAMEKLGFDLLLRETPESPKTFPF